MGKIQGVLFIFVLGLCVRPASAQNLNLEVGLHAGGDELVRVIYTSGSSSSVKAGQLLSLAIGAGFNISKNLASRITFGYKTDFATATNGDVSFSRYPVNLLLLYKAGRFQLGGGITYHISPKLSGSGVASFVNTDFDNATGGLLEADYFFSQSSYFGFRYTSINYTLKSTSISVDGNSVGVVLGALL